MTAPTPREVLLTMKDDIDGLADAYTVDAPLVAEVCDEVLDRSGGLLGRVRQRVRETGRFGGYPRVALTRREPLDVEVLAEILRRLGWTQPPTGSGRPYRNPDMAFVANVRDVAAEYADARLEAER